MDPASGKALADDDRGQTFVEFLFLLLSIMGLSYLLLGGIGTGIGKRWETLVKGISETSDQVKLQ